MWNIIEFDEVASTNTLAGEMLARGDARHGDVIVARHQTAGRGRASGRVWNDEAGASLLMSSVLTEITEPAHLLQYRIAFAVLCALRELATEQDAAHKSIRLKWPNDILIEDKKVCGILLEAQWNGSAMHSAIAGIGVNIGQQSFPEELALTATSLAMSGMTTSAPALRDRILDAMERELVVQESKAVLARLDTELAWMSRIPWLELITDGDRVAGLHYLGIADSGALKLCDDERREILVRTGSLVFDWQNR